MPLQCITTQSITTDNTGHINHDLTSVGYPYIYYSNGNGNTIVDKSYVDDQVYYVETINIDGLDDNIKNRLETRFVKIKNKCIYFNVFLNTDNNNIEPIEKVLYLINQKKKFDMIINKSNFNVKLKGVLLKKIKNLSDNSSNKFIKVKFTYEQEYFINTSKTEIQKRQEKINYLKEKTPKT